MSSPYVNYAKQRKESRDKKIANHPYKSRAEKDEAQERIAMREKKALERATK